MSSSDSVGDSEKLKNSLIEAKVSAAGLVMGVYVEKALTLMQLEALKEASMKLGPTDKLVCSSSPNTVVA